MKRPTDKQVRYAKISLWILLIFTGIIAFWVQDLKIESSLFGIMMNEDTKKYLAYAIIALWAIPLVLGGLDISILSRGYTRILQIISGIGLMILSSIFVDTATLSIDIMYFLLGLIVLFAGITGKAITKKGLKHGQKITKIRV